MPIDPRVATPRRTSRQPPAAPTSCPPARSWSPPAGGSRPCPPAARPGWSTTSTTAWPGAAAAAVCPRRPLRRPGRPAGGAVSGRLGPGPAHHRPLSDRLGRKPLITGGMLLQAIALAGTAVAGSFVSGRRARSCSGPAPPWSIPPCWPRSATSPTPAGAPPRSGSTGCGATPASPWAPCWPAWWPTSPAWRPRWGRRRPHGRLRLGRCRAHVRDPPTGAAATTTPLRFATFLAPNMLPVYRFLADRIGHRLGRRVELVVGRSFDQFEQGEADLGVICGLPYVWLAARRPHRWSRWPPSPDAATATPAAPSTTRM